MVTNAEIFQGKLQNVKFIALVAKELNGRFVQTWNEYNGTIAKIDQLDPEVIRRKFRQMIHEFFKQLKQRLDV